MQTGWRSVEGGAGSGGNDSMQGCRQKCNEAGINSRTGSLCASHPNPAARGCLLQTALAEYVKSADLTTTLADYMKSADLPAAVHDEVDKELSEDGLVKTEDLQVRGGSPCPMLIFQEA